MYARAHGLHTCSQEGQTESSLYCCKIGNANEKRKVAVFFAFHRIYRIRSGIISGKVVLPGDMNRNLGVNDPFYDVQGEHEKNHAA